MALVNSKMYSVSKVWLNEKEKKLWRFQNNQLSTTKTMELRILDSYACKWTSLKLPQMSKIKCFEID